MSGFVNHLLNLPPGWVYLAVGLLVFAEDALFVGFVLPGETAAIIGGVTASTHHTNLFAMIGIVCVAAILGDSVGYEIGSRYGVRVLNTRPLARRRARVDDAREFLARRGGPAVFLGRFVAFFRAIMPFLSGTAHMHYRKFLAYNAAGGITWGVAVVLLGYFAGLSYQKVASRFGEVAAIIVGAIVIAAVVIWRIRRHRQEKREDAPDKE
jgi:membrane protein DedA with SNARE-associated domain